MVIVAVREPGPGLASTMKVEVLVPGKVDTEPGCTHPAVDGIEIVQGAQPAPVTVTVTPKPLCIPETCLLVASSEYVQDDPPACCTGIGTVAIVSVVLRAAPVFAATE